MPPGPLATLAGMLTAHVTYYNLPDDDKTAYLKARASFKHPPTEPLRDGPGDITVLAQVLQAVLKVATAVTTSRTFGTNEDIGEALLCSAFADDALNLARTALSDTPPSNNVVRGDIPGSRSRDIGYEFVNFRRPDLSKSRMG